MIDEEAAPVPADTISFASSSVSKTYGDAVFVNTLTNTGDGTVTFSSSDTSVATVNASSGQVTIVKAGSATITATVTDGATSHYEVNTASYTLNVARASRTISFSSQTEVVITGNTITNAAIVSDGTSDGTLSYTSANTYVATVDQSGNVTGVAEGVVVITASITGGVNYDDASGSYIISVSQVAPQPVATDYAYTGEMQSAILSPGIYTFECWGAQGGSAGGGVGGKGGYSVGTLLLTSSATVYIYVGGHGAGRTSSGLSAGGFNGGGDAYVSRSTYNNGSGGGASDIRIGQDSLYARVIVAGGGGGYGRYNSSNVFEGGYGGGASGGDGIGTGAGATSGKGGTQTSVGDSYYGNNQNSTTYGNLAGFGVGGGAISGVTSYQTNGGGGGWYGGGYSQRAGAGGGSGYVYTSSSASNYPSGCLLDSSYYLSNTDIADGNTSFPSTSGSTETGHEGNGFIRITKIA